MSIIKKFDPYVVAVKGYVKSLFTRYEDDGRTTGDVDFVVTWVDGNDPDWQSEKSKYDSNDAGNGVCRYRDWVTFRYWFRAVEKYAPWVRYIYLVTWGHVPDWLNIDSPKLRIVRHEAFIPKEYLPTFNCNPIELNLHRIPGLSECFVYFNDDVMPVKPLKKTDFFVNGNPCYPALSDYFLSWGNMVSYHIYFSQYSEINGKNDLRTAMKKNPEKWFSKAYGKAMHKNITAYKLNGLCGMFFSHMGAPLRKSTFEKSWRKYMSIEETCRHKFRTPMDVSHFLITAEDILNGCFVPISPNNIGTCINIDDFVSIGRVFREKRYLMICFNDSNTYTKAETEKINERIENILNEFLSKKSIFEQ